MMNTRLIYKIDIHTLVGTKYDFHEADLRERDYKKLINDLSSDKFITILNTDQDLITISTNTIYKIETIVSIDADAKSEEN